MSQINLRPLKRLVLEKFPASTFRDIILSEKDRMDAREFVIKLEVWLKLLKVIGKEVVED